jgi:hypothetical protein
MRHLRFAIPFALVGVFVLAATALAGGWAQVTLTDPPVDPGAGTPTAVTFTVKQHGETPVSWPRLTVVATDSQSGTVVRTDAKPDGPTGRYVAVMTLPTEGTWALTFDSMDLVMEGQATLTVGAAVPVVPVSPAAAEPVPAAGPDVLSIALVGVSILTLLAVIAIGIRGRNGRHGESVVRAGG